jgi:maltooligosyltrehalose trehalohydrolase
VFAKVATSAFFHDGTYSTFREKVHGRPVDRDQISGSRFVVCLQNHDQVGNRAAGERLSELTTPDLQRVGAVLLFTLPFTPMLWMGEEWAASTRWPFFTSHPEPELAQAVSEGRVEEFDGFGWDPGDVVDPQDPSAFRAAKLNWRELEQPDHARMLQLYTQLAALRAHEPELRDGDLNAVSVDYDEKDQWLVLHRGDLHVAVNLADTRQLVGLVSQTAPINSELVLSTGANTKLENTGISLPPRTAAIVRIVS